MGTRLKMPDNLSGYKGHNKLLDRINRRNNLLDKKQGKKGYKTFWDRALSGYRKQKNKGK
mgnify:CR=1 FL=1